MRSYCNTFRGLGTPGTRFVAPWDTWDSFSVSWDLFWVPRGTRFRSRGTRFWSRGDSFGGTRPAARATSRQCGRRILICRSVQNARAGPVGTTQLCKLRYGSAPVRMSITQGLIVRVTCAHSCTIHAPVLESTRRRAAPQVWRHGVRSRSLGGTRFIDKSISPPEDRPIGSVLCFLQAQPRYGMIAPANESQKRVPCPRRF